MLNFAGVFEDISYLFEKFELLLNAQFEKIRCYFIKLMDYIILIDCKSLFCKIIILTNHN